MGLGFRVKDFGFGEVKNIKEGSIPLWSPTKTLILMINAPNPTFYSTFTWRRQGLKILTDGITDP